MGPVILEPSEYELRPGDVLLAINGKKLETLGEGGR